MTTYHLELFEHPDDGAARTLADLDTEEPAVMAATLRAVADRLDPPQPVRPAYRLGDHMRAALGDDMPQSARCPAVHPDSGRPCIVSGPHVGRDHRQAWAAAGQKIRWRDAPVDAPDAAPATVRRTRITPDGCGPEHTFTGSCHLAVQGRPD